MSDTAGSKSTDQQLIPALPLYFFLKLLIITIMHMGRTPGQEELLSAGRSGVS